MEAEFVGMGYTYRVEMTPIEPQNYHKLLPGIPKGAIQQAAFEKYAEVEIVLKMEQFLKWVGDLAWPGNEII